MKHARVLAVVDRPLIPIASGVSYSAYHHLRHLARTFEVDLAVVDSRSESADTKAPSWTAKQIVLAREPKKSRVLRALDEVSLRRPTFLAYPAAEHKTVLAQMGAYDIVYVSPVSMASYASLIPGRNGRAPLRVVGLNDSLTLTFERFGTLVKQRLLTGRSMGLAMTHAFRSIYMPIHQKQVLSSFDLVVVQSELDRVSVDHDLGEAGKRPRVIVVPNGIKKELLECEYRGWSNRKLGHVGLLGEERSDLFFWFMKHVFLPLRQEFPDLSIELVGSVGGQVRHRLAGMPGLVLSGFVPSLARPLQTFTATVAPVFMNCGVVNKVIDSMAAGVPTVGSGVFSGIKGFVDGCHGFDVRRAKEWRSALRQILISRARADAISEAARQLMAASMCWSTSLDVLDSEVGALLEQHGYQLSEAGKSSVSREL